MTRRAVCAIAALGLLLLSACAGAQVSGSTLGGGLAEARSFQTADKAAIIRAVAETILEAGFVLDRVDPDGKLWGTAETDFSSFKVVATVTPRGADTMVVRFVADRGQGAAVIAIDEPQFYEDKFFKPLAENLRLPASPAS